MSEDHTAFIESYLEAVAEGATGAKLAAFFDPEVIQEEFPNRLVAGGARRDIAAILDSAAKSRALMRNQHFAVHGVISAGENAAAEATWTGVLAVPLGKLAPGDVMRARFAMFFTFRNGLIHRQRNYDCFYPF